MNHKGTVKIETERLILRKAIPEDIEPMFHNWANDERVTKFMTWQPHSDISVTAQYNKYRLLSGLFLVASGNHERSVFRGDQILI